MLSKHIHFLFFKEVLDTSEIPKLGNTKVLMPGLIHIPYLKQSNH